MAASCVMTGMHASIDVVAGGALALLAWNAGAVGSWMRAATERIANSWREWRFGPVRIINHGAYAGVGTFLGLWAIGVLLGPAHLAEVFFVAVAGLVSAGLWAQFIEGSPSLLRPYGYYGGVLGVVVATVVVQLVRGDAWPLLAGFALAGPVIQATGRLRCLVQGCCHGRETNAGVGIRYVHPRSRVCRLAHLKGVPIHPTPLYSILGNVVTGAILFRLWRVAAPLPLICGLYLILNGLARFVEEAYRGEPQTPRFGGLAVYHYMAIASVLAGIGVTMMRTESTFDAPEFTWGAIGVAALFGIVATAGLGLDFPESNRRFSRLV
jgi:prolipoprotein diacylglyceryltransferase